LSAHKIIHLENVTKSFLNIELKRKITALKEINLSVEEGEFICIIGPSGCGKTTVLNLLAGFENPTFGRIFFKGSEIKGPGPRRVMISQVSTLYPWLTVYQNIEFGLKLQGLRRKQRREIAREYLSFVGLKAFGNSRPHELSGGMGQKVALGQALALNPDVLLMDEPFGALDALSRIKLQDELLRIWNHTQKTVIFVTHNVEEAVYLGDRVIVFTPLPGKVRANIVIDIPRPRTRLDGNIHLAQKVVLSELDGRNDKSLGRCYKLFGKEESECKTKTES